MSESAVWNDTEEALYWVDIPRGELYRWSSKTLAISSRHLNIAVGSFGFRQSGGLVLATQSGFALLEDFIDGQIRFLNVPEFEISNVQFNDGKVSPDGHFFAGTMDEIVPRRSIGRLYRLTSDGESSVIADGIKVSNGLAWSPDGCTLYHSDLDAGVIYRHAYDSQTGKVGEREIFVTLQPEWGLPDGGAVDISGNYWSCGYSAGRINCFDPQGVLIAFVSVPVVHPTMPCFGGVDMKTLYFTSLSDGYTVEQWRVSPLAGGVFSFEVEVPGVPVHRFKG